MPCTTASAMTTGHRAKHGSHSQGLGLELEPCLSAAEEGPSIAYV